MRATELIFNTISDFFGFFFTSWYVVLDEYERGIVLRLGKFNRRLEPGFNLVIPFGFEEVFVDNVVPATERLPVQSIVTADDEEMSVTLVVKWSIHDLKLFALTVEDGDSVLEDAVASTFAICAVDNDFDEVASQQFLDEILDLARAKAAPFGVTLESIGYVDCTTAQNLRILGDTSLAVDLSDDEDED